MAVDVIVTTNKIASDPTARNFLNFVQANSERLGLADGVVYYDFPTYADYETVRHKPDLLLISSSRGIIAVKFIDASAQSIAQSRLSDADESIGQFCSILIGRLIKSKALRMNLGQLKFNVMPVLYVTDGTADGNEIEVSQTAQSLEGFAQLINSAPERQLAADELAEIRSVVEGAKALARPQKRSIENPASQKHAVALSKLEAEIANFDQRQRRAALVTVPGPQRIRGLAGSGKTVILAMKAAHLHLERCSTWLNR